MYIDSVMGRPEAYRDVAISCYGKNRAVSILEIEGYLF
jgi:hypothetical protein